jgi:hypothetical protein
MRNTSAAHLHLVRLDQQDHEQSGPAGLRLTIRPLGFLFGLMMVVPVHIVMMVVVMMIDLMMFHRLIGRHCRHCH